MAHGNPGGALASPFSAYLYDWNLLPIGQILWEKELMSYKEFPPLQMRRQLQPRQILAVESRNGRQAPERLIERRNPDHTSGRAVRPARRFHRFEKEPAR